MSGTMYTSRLNVAVPESLMEPANHLAVSIGEAAGDFYSFTNANWQDAQGNLYAVMSTQVTPLLFEYAGLPLERRDFAPEEWSLELATQAQMAVNIWFGPTQQQPEMPTATPGVILGVVGDDPLGIFAAMGLTRLPEEMN